MKDRIVPTRGYWQDALRTFRRANIVVGVVYIDAELFYERVMQILHMCRECESRWCFVQYGHRHRARRHAGRLVVP